MAAFRTKLSIDDGFRADTKEAHYSDQYCR